MTDRPQPRCGACGRFISKQKDLENFGKCDQCQDKQWEQLSLESLEEAPIID